MKKWIGALLMASVVGTASADSFAPGGSTWYSEIASGSVIYARTFVNMVADLVASVNNIATEQIKALAVTTAKIATSAITNAKLADDSVTSGKIVDGTIATTDIADSAITSAKIADATITAEDIADSAITSAKISNGEIVDADISASAAITTTKINFTTPSSTELTDIMGSLWGFRASEPTGVTDATHNSWTNFDCDSYWSGTLPTGRILAILMTDISVTYVNSTYRYATMGFRPEGATWVPPIAIVVYANSSDSILPTYNSGYALVPTDENHVLEYYALYPGTTSGTARIYMVGYIGPIPK